MSAYNTESALARLLRPHYARGQDEARALLREAFTLTGDLQIIGDWTAGSSSDFRPHVGFSPESTRNGYVDTSKEAVV
jgi:hypothetical protein